MSDVIARARPVLNDEAAVEAEQRYTDTQLLAKANDYLREARAKMPDLFLGQYLSAHADKALGDDFPLGEEYFVLCTHYVIAHAESRDDAHANSGRAAGFLNLSQRARQGA